MNLPNILTISRIVLAVALVFLLEESTLIGNSVAVIVFTIASLTDFYDGHLARRKGLVNNFGKIMDPVADKVLILSVLGALAHLGMVDWWMFIVIAVREILVTASRIMLMRRGQVLAAERAGKIKTIIQIIAVSAILLFLVAKQCEFCSVWFSPIQNIWLIINKWLMILAVVMTVYSGIDYFQHRSLK